MKQNDVFDTEPDFDGRNSPEKRPRKRVSPYVVVILILAVLLSVVAWLTYMKLQMPAPFYYDGPFDRDIQYVDYATNVVVFLTGRAGL